MQVKKLGRRNICKRWREYRATELRFTTEKQTEKESQIERELKPEV
jgi:ribosome-binding factor A